MTYANQIVCTTKSNLFITTSFSSPTSLTIYLKDLFVSFPGGATKVPCLHRPLWLHSCWRWWSQLQWRYAFGIAIMWSKRENFMIRQPYWIVFKIISCHRWHLCWCDGHWWWLDGRVWPAHGTVWDVPFQLHWQDVMRLPWLISPAPHVTAHTHVHIPQYACRVHARPHAQRVAQDLLVMVENVARTVSCCQVLCSCC